MGVETGEGQLQAFVDATKAWMINVGPTPARWGAAVESAIQESVLGDEPLDREIYENQRRRGILKQYFNMDRAEQLAAQAIPGLNFNEYIFTFWKFLNAPSFWASLMRQGDEASVQAVLDTLPEQSIREAPTFPAKIVAGSAAFSERTVRFQGVTMVGLGLAALLGSQVKDVILPTHNALTSRQAIEMVGSSMPGAATAESLHPRVLAMLGFPQAGYEGVRPAPRALGLDTGYAAFRQSTTCPEIVKTQDALGVLGRVLQHQPQAFHA